MLRWCLEKLKNPVSGSHSSWDGGAMIVTHYRDTLQCAQGGVRVVTGRVATWAHSFTGNCEIIVLARTFSIIWHEPCLLQLRKWNSGKTNCLEVIHPRVTVTTLLRGARTVCLGSWLPVSTEVLARILASYEIVRSTLSLSSSISSFKCVPEME